MSQNLLITAGIAAGVVSLMGLVPYIRDIFRNKTKPERAMWWIYSALFALLFAAQLSAGASWLLIVTGTYVVSSALVAVLSLKYGYGSFHKRDAISLIIAAVGLGLWLVTSQPLLAILLVIIIDFAGFWLTLIKTWYAPHSETLITWQLNFVSAILSIFAVGGWKLSLIIYPFYAAIGTGLFVWLIIFRRKKIKNDLHDF